MNASLGRRCSNECPARDNHQKDKGFPLHNVSWTRMTPDLIKVMIKSGLTSKRRKTALSAEDK
jgi:hypothetical protein